MSKKFKVSPMDKKRLENIQSLAHDILDGATKALNATTVEEHNRFINDAEQLMDPMVECFDAIEGGDE